MEAKEKGMEVSLKKLSGNYQKTAVGCIGMIMTVMLIYTVLDLVSTLLGEPVEEPELEEGEEAEEGSDEAVVDGGDEFGDDTDATMGKSEGEIDVIEAGRRLGSLNNKSLNI